MKLHRDRSEQVEGAVQVYLFSDLKLEFGPGHVIEQKFEDYRAAETAAFDLEIAEA